VLVQHDAASPTSPRAHGWNRRWSLSPPVWTGTHGSVSPTSSSRSRSASPARRLPSRQHVSPGGSPACAPAAPANDGNGPLARSSAAAPIAPLPPSGVRTRLQQGIRHPKIYKDGTVRYGMFTSTGEPSSLSL
jgi:hypothetical protein